jgi:hypothetical protein
MQSGLHKLKASQVQVPEIDPRWEVTGNVISV